MTTTKEQTMDEVTQALSPCPFCRGEKFQQNTKAKGYFVKRAAQREGKDQSNHLIRCTKCGAKGPLSKSPAEAIAAWNTRATIAQQGEELARLREAGNAMRDKLLGFVGAMALYTDCGPDVDAIKVWEAI